MSVALFGMTGGTHVKQKFDDVRVWNVAKTQAELQAGMNSELAGTEAGSNWILEIR